MVGTLRFSFSFISFSLHRISVYDRFLFLYRSFFTFPVCRGGNPQFFLKAVAEIILVGVSASAADIFQGEIGFCKIAAGFFNTERGNGITDALLCVFLIECAQVGGAHINVSGNIIQA